MEHSSPHRLRVRVSRGLGKRRCFRGKRSRKGLRERRPHKVKPNVYGRDPKPSPIKLNPLRSLSPVVSPKLSSSAIDCASVSAPAPLLPPPARSPRPSHGFHQKQRNPCGSITLSINRPRRALENEFRFASNGGIPSRNRTFERFDPKNLTVAAVAGAPARPPESRTAAPMSVVGSNRFFLNPSEKETLARMAGVRPRGSRAVDGEASDGDSSESAMEIFAEDFKKEPRTGRSGVWMGYPMSKNYAPSLYSFAWAQAVQNKPLGLDLMPMTDADLASKNDIGVKPAKEDTCDVIIEDGSQEGNDGMEKEEGELEEGEIELGTELVVADEMAKLSSDKPENEPEKKEPDEEESQDMGDFDKRVSLILEDLETITIEEAEA